MILKFSVIRWLLIYDCKNEIGNKQIVYIFTFPRKLCPKGSITLAYEDHCIELNSVKMFMQFRSLMCKLLYQLYWYPTMQKFYKI